MKTLCCSSVWTGGESPPLGPSRIIIDGDRIEAILPAARQAPGLHVIPAFVDAHCHFLWMGLAEASLDLSGCRGKSDILDALASAGVKDGITRGEGWDESLWPDPSLPGLEEIDAAAGGNPVFLRRICGHAALVSTAMLRLLAGRCGRLDPPPDGPLVREDPVLRSFDLFPPSERELDDAKAAAEAKALSMGVTALSSTESSIHAMRLLEDGPARIGMTISVFEGGRGAVSGPASRGRVSITGRKMFLDGAFGARTAAVAGAFRDGSSGMLLHDDETLERMISDAWRAGLRPVVHAIGGRALGQLDRVGGRCRAKDPRGSHAGIRVEHAEELLAVWPGGWTPGFHFFSMQPNFVRRWQLPGGMYEDRLPAEDAVRLNPFRTVLGAGLLLGFGSDCMPFGPLWGLEGATAHPEASLGLTREEALRAYTLDAAAVAGFEDLAVPLGPGRPADLAVLSADPLSAPWDGIRVVATIAGGCPAWGETEVLGNHEPS